MEAPSPKPYNNPHNIEMTPYRTQSRPYLSNPHTLKHLNYQNMNNEKLQTPRRIGQTFYQEQPFEQRGIYGTNILTVKVQQLLTRFIEQFSIQQNLQEQKIYLNKIGEIDYDQLPNFVFTINALHIKQFDTELYNQLVYFPAQIISLLDEVIKKLYQKYCIDIVEDTKIIRDKQQKKIQLMSSIQNLSTIISTRNLTEIHINRLVSFRGIVIRTSEICPEMKTAVFRCINSRCKNEVEVLLVDAKVNQPLKCTRCNMNQSYELIHNHSRFTDKQFVKIQELPENVQEGQTPSSVSVICYDSSVNNMRPGDRVQIVGIFRCQARKLRHSRLSIQAVYYTYTDMISVKIIQQNRFKVSQADFRTVFTAEEQSQIRKLAYSQNIIDDLVDSFAPSIYGHQNIKLGLLSQIFGGTTKDFQGRGRFRSDINICLVGDPSTAKSQLLKQVYNTAPRGIYTSGKGSSAVGLTANVRKDPQTREFVLQSGALVLSDLGICCIDEFDKMDQNSKLVLLQAMQQQTISVAKAGIVCQLNSRTSILSAANPILSKYDINKSVVENINLHPALLSRFDLIYIILDIPEKKLDMRLAMHILNIFSQRQLQTQNPPKINHQIFSKYITYAREKIHPKITNQAGLKLVQLYTQMRRKGQNTKTITATVRQLESLIRISEAFAKMKLSQFVTKQNVIKAFDLIQQALKQSAIDPTTGKIDMDVIVTGQTSASRKRVDNIINLLNNIFQANPSDWMQKRTIFEKVFEQVTRRFNELEQGQARPREQDIIDALNKMQIDGIVQLSGLDRKRRPLVKFIKQQHQ